MKTIHFLAIIGLVTSINLLVFTNNYRGADSDPLKQWNEAKQCFDQSDYPPTFKAQPRDESLDYDPNWVEAVNKPDGCTYYMHPNQGQGNNPPEKEIKEPISKTIQNPAAGNN